MKTKLWNRIVAALLVVCLLSVMAPTALAQPLDNELPDINELDGNTKVTLTPSPSVVTHDLSNASDSTVYTIELTATLEMSPELAMFASAYKADKRMNEIIFTAYLELPYVSGYGVTLNPDSIKLTSKIFDAEKIDVVTLSDTLIKIVCPLREDWSTVSGTQSLVQKLQEKMTFTGSANITGERIVEDVAAGKNILRMHGYVTLKGDILKKVTKDDSTEIKTPTASCDVTLRITDGVRVNTPEALNTEDHYAYINGYTDGTVRPQGSITRAELTTFFFRTLKDEVRAANWSSTNAYSDVSSTAWYNNAVSTISKMGILNGYSDGTFRPNNQVTRAELVKIAVSFYDDVDTSYATNYTDIKGHWAENYINAATSLGLITGYTDGTFRPNNPVTRAEAITIINRIIGRKPHVGGMYANMNKWSDCQNVNAWYYADIQEATNSHTFSMSYVVGTAVYELWIKALPERNWSDLEKTWSNAYS